MTEQELAAIEAKVIVYGPLSQMDTAKLIAEIRRLQPKCVCKENALGVVHRTDGPCYQLAVEFSPEKCAEIANNPHRGSSFDEFMLKDYEQNAKELAELKQQLADAPTLGHRCRTMYWCQHDRGSGIWAKPKKGDTYSAKLVDIKKLGET